MGIHKFYSHFIKTKYAAATNVNILKNNSIYGLYIDLNGLLHRCKFITYGGDGHDLDSDLMDLFRENNLNIDKNTKQRALVVKNKTEKELLDTYESVFSTLLLNLVNAYSPIAELGLYVDGKVPMAKIQQQRRRREKSSLDRAKNLKYNPFDGALISPGTPFMYWVDEMIKRWINRHINHEFVPAKIIYSNHLVPGEGEHKIMDHLRDINETKEGAFNHTYIVVGLDADLVILSLMQKLEGIVLVRENSEDILQIDALKSMLINDLGTEWAPYDFCVMMSLLGNDFLPEKLGTSKVKELEVFFDIYKLLVKDNLTYSLTMTPNPRSNELKMNWEEMTLFMEHVQAYEEYVKYLEMAKRVNVERALVRKSIVKVNEEYAFSFEKYRVLWYNHIFKNRGLKNLSQYMFYQEDKNSVDEIKEDIQDMSYKYLEGIEWNLLYYMKGHYGVSQKWFYPYHHPPLYTDMYNYLSKKNANLDFKVKYNKEEDTFTVLHQLVSIIPKTSVPLAFPVQMHKVPDQLDYVDMFPSSILFDDEGIYIDTFRGKKDEYQIVPLMPMIEPLRVEQLIGSVLKDFTARELIIFCEQKEKVYNTINARAGRMLVTKVSNKEQKKEREDKEEKKSKNKSVSKSKAKSKSIKDDEKSEISENIKKSNKKGHVFEMFDFNSAPMLVMK